MLNEKIKVGDVITMSGASVPKDIAEQSLKFTVKAIDAITGEITLDIPPKSLKQHLRKYGVKR